MIHLHTIVISCTYTSLFHFDGDDDDDSLFFTLSKYTSFYNNHSFDFDLMRKLWIGIKKKQTCGKEERKKRKGSERYRKDV